MIIQIMDKHKSETQLPHNVEVVPDIRYASQLEIEDQLSFDRPNMQPGSANSQVNSEKINKVISSKTFSMLQKRKDPEQPKSFTKPLITQEDQDKINQSKETIAKAKDFRQRAQQINVSVALVSQQELSQILNPVRAPEMDNIDHFLFAIKEIMQAESINKHPVEMEQIDLITRVISSTRQGEQCREVLRYIGNLRKQFNDCLSQLESVTAQAGSRFSKVREFQIEQNNALSAELMKVQKLTSSLKHREGENVQLKQQLESLIESLKQRDIQQEVEKITNYSKSQQLIDDKRENDIISLSQRLEQELQSNKALSLMEKLKNEIGSFIQENTKLKIDFHHSEMKLEAQSRNLEYLEEKLASILTEREEQVVELKSKIVIYQQKARNAKQKLNFRLEEVKKIALQEEQANVYKEKQIVELQIIQLQAVLSERDSEIKELESHAEKNNKRIEEIQKQFKEQLEGREQKYQTLKDQLNQQEHDHQNKLRSQTDQNVTEKRTMDRFEQELNIKELRLEYLESNQRKMQQQKEFLEKQIARDIREMQQQMIKTKLEIKKDQLISSQSALQRLEQMYAMMQQSLRHVTRVVSFMTFDVDNQTLDLVNISDQEEGPGLLQEVNQMQELGQLGENIYNDQKNEGITTEQAIQKYPLELIESLVQWLFDLMQSSNSQPSEDIEQMLNLLKLRTSSTKVEDISRIFLLSNRLNFDQYLFRLNEKNKALQEERDRLQKKLSEQHEEMEEIMADYDEEIKHESPRIQDLEPSIQVKKQNFHLKASVSKRLNEALTERIRDIKLILNRKYFELEDQMKLQKEKYEMEISQMRVQYGKDLNSVHIDCKNALNFQRKEIDEAHKIDFQRLKVQFSDQFKKLKSDFEEALKKINKEKMQERFQKQQYFSELKKQKKESCGLYAGGYGTFTIAFENPVHAKIVKCQQQLIEHQQDFEILKQSLQGAKAKLKLSTLQNHQEEEKVLQEEFRSLQQKLEQTEILPIEKLNHFIEVGFQISSRNYQPLMTYNDQLYESMAKKYVFEFQDPLDQTKIEGDEDKIEEETSQLLQKENLLKQQISDNFALFNEINPIYISLNLGRSVSTFPEESLPIENFRLAHRISANVSSQQLTINFLKADLPFNCLRIMAFNNQTCQSYELDLNKQDLLVFVDSNLKFLEDENSTDLYNLIANSLTIISRKSTHRQNIIQIQVLAVEHRCYFNELYRNNWDARNKKIKARHNKFNQGLIQEISCITDFDQSILYEGFEEVFQTEVTLDLAKQQADHFSIKLLRGLHSGHLKLIVKLLYSNDIEATLCLMKSVQSSDQSIIFDDNKCQNLAATLIQKPEQGDNNQALAYMISIEKIFGTPDEQNLLIKITSLQKRDADNMLNFTWQGSEPPSLGSTKTISEVIYLTKKAGEPNQFCQVKEFDILNTEVRAQLFSHAFGYQQVIADFGNLSTQDHQDDQLEKKLILPRSLEVQKSNFRLLFRSFTIIRVKYIDDKDEEQIESQYAHVAFLTSFRLAEQNILKLEIQVPELNIEIVQDIPYIIFTSEQYDQFIQKIDAEKYAQVLIDYLIVNQTEKTVEINEKFEAFSQLMLQMKQSQLDETIAKIGNVQFQLEFPEPKLLQVSKSDLVDCQKIHTVALIGQRPFKITCYFLLQLKKFKPKQKNKFDFDCIFVEVISIAQDLTFELILTEHDIGTLVEMLMEATQHKTAVEFRISCEKLFNKDLSKKQLMSFVIALLDFDSQTKKVFVSFEQLLAKTIERRKLEIEFIQTGGKYVKPDPQIKQNEYQSEFKKTLITSGEKDLSNSKIYIKIYKCSLNSLPGMQKLLIEINDVQEPQIVFRIEYLTSQENLGKQILIERFSLLEKSFSEHNTEKSPIQNHGLVFIISETAFPHEINLILLEPCSHIFWNYVVKDDKINMIDKRIDRQAFAIQLEKCLQTEIYRDINNFREVVAGYQKRDNDEQFKTEILKCKRQQLAAMNIGDLDLVYGRTFIFEQGFVEIRLFFSYEAQKFSLEWREKSKDDKVINQINWQVSVLNQTECSRFYQGSMGTSNGQRLIVQIEQACAQSGLDSCIRISFHKIIPSQLQPIFDLIIVEPNLLKQDFSLREDYKFELGIGYKDTLASIFKMNDISNDIAFSKIQPPAVPILQPKKDPWSLIYRKVIKQNDQNFIVSALQHETLEMLKLNVFESISTNQQIFVFNAADVLTATEMLEIQQKPNKFEEFIKLAVNTRLKIRELTDAKRSSISFSASFLNPTVILNQQQNQIALNQLFPGIEEFDIRNECTNSLFQPTNIFQQEQKQKNTLLAQFSRDDFQYDVYQVLDPFKLVLKIQVYNLQTFQLIASAMCDENELKQELASDQKSNLLEGPKREQLAQYLISNSHLDEKRQLMLFYKSH